jgi:decaprenylphospho-beta-D-ribofuranose 2-oxidase
MSFEGSDPARLGVLRAGPSALRGGSLRRDAVASKVAGWGGVSVDARELRSEDFPRIAREAVISRGLGRSYGDSSLPPPGRTVANSTLSDRILSFDPTRGILRAEAGFSVAELNRIFLPRGFFVPVSSGTQFVTLGGMVAADVHGKNHHREGSFGAHTLALALQTADGARVVCSREEELDLFRATLGGMGLTGHILEVTCRLARVPSSWVLAETERIRDIDAFVQGLKEAGQRWPHTVGWIDCLSSGANLGRGILMRGRWAEPGEAPPDPPRPRFAPSIPFSLPSFVVGRASVRAFNALYYRMPQHRGRLVHPWAFFYPLDAIGSWNRLYGHRGFTQYQCVLPDPSGGAAARKVLGLLARRGGASMLCVIKDCGKEGEGLLSFPKSGISIALDIPIRETTQSLIDALNEQVIALGGRIYLAKDQFTRRDHFEAMEPRLPEWNRIRRLWDPEGRLRSAQSVRLLGDSP